MEHLELKSRQQQQVANTNLFLPGLGIGCAPLGEIWDKVKAKDALDTLLEAADAHGITYFDTAPWYGNGCSEARLGVAVNEMNSINHSRKIKISTKVGKFLDPSEKESNMGPWAGGYNLKMRLDYSYDGIIQQHRESCLRLGLPSVDALVIHDLDFRQIGEKVVEYRKQLINNKNGGLKALLALKQSGKIKAVGIGCNSFDWGSLDTCKEVFEAARNLEIAQKSNVKALDYVLCAGDFNLISQRAFDELIPLCEKYGLSLVVGAAYGGNGILATGVKKLKERENLKFNYDTASQEIVDKVVEIEECCEKHGVSIGAAALQYPLMHPLVKCVLAGVKNKDELSLAVKYMDESIPDNLWEELKLRKLIR